jgi:hypothetical protein
MLKVGRKRRRFGTQGLLQPFAYGVADRSACFAIDLFAVVGGQTIHDAFRLLSIPVQMLDKSPGWKLFPVFEATACFCGGNQMAAAIRFHLVELK